MLNHLVVLFLIFWGTPILFSMVATSAYNSHRQCTRVPFSPYPLQDSLFCLFDNSQFDGHEVIILRFWFAFSWWLVMWSIFACTSWPPVCLLWKMSIQVLCSFSNWVVVFFFFCCWVPWVYVFWVLTPYQMYDMQVYSLTDSVAFSFCWCFFAVKKLMSMMSHLFIFAFVAFAFNVESEKLPKWMSQSLLLLFSSKILTVSSLTFRSLIHFKMIFCIWYKIVVQFHSFECGCPVFAEPFIEETVLSLLYSLSTFVVN